MSYSTISGMRSARYPLQGATYRPSKTLVLTKRSGNWTLRAPVDPQAGRLSPTYLHPAFSLGAGCGCGCGGNGGCGMGQKAAVEQTKSGALSVVLLGLGAGFLWAMSRKRRR